MKTVLITREELLGEIHPGIIEDSIVISPDARRIAYITKNGDKQFVVVDGREGDTYETIWSLKFSPDAMKVGYTAKHRGKCFIVVDDIEHEKYHEIGRNSFIFSPDSKQIAYTAKFGTKWSLIIEKLDEDGLEYKEKEYDIEPSRFCFSPDSKRFAYTYRVDELHLVVDGEVIDGCYRYDDFDLTSPVFSPDSKRIAFLHKLGGLAVLDGKDKLVLDQPRGKAEQFIFSPDSKRLSWVESIRSGDSIESIVIVDGVEEKLYAGRIKQLMFSPNSKRIAYGVWSGLVVVDGEESKKYREVSDIHFSHDSKHVAYMAKNLDYSWSFVKDENETTAFPWKSGPIFSPDGNRMSYVGGTGNYLVADGVKDKKYNRIERVIFSPDSKHIAYIAQRGKKWIIVVNGSKGNKYYSRNNGLYIENYIKQPITQLVFDNSRLLHFLALRGNKMLRVEVEILEK